jgi:NAD(P)-dependent dehydrogenase (short-subunit alcohol dehydrogenase family)
MNYQAQFCLDSKVIIITGASSGIGRECAIAASQLGARVVLLARDSVRLEQTLESMSGEGHLVVPHDITDYESLEGIVKESVDKLGKISGFIHSAGIENTIPLRSMSAIDYELFFRINVISGFELARIISQKKHINQEGGSFVFISSVLGAAGQPGKIGYCASKGAILTACKAMALELAPKKIRCNAVLPGAVMTEMTKAYMERTPEEAVSAFVKMHPLGMGQPEDVSCLCSFLLSDASKWITGTNINVDGGYSAQ